MTECSYCRCRSLRTAVQTNSKDEDNKSEIIFLRNCPRCNRVAYCSRQCQRVRFLIHVRKMFACRVSLEFNSHGAANIYDFLPFRHIGFIIRSIAVLRLARILWGILKGGWAQLIWY